MNNQTHTASAAPSFHCCVTWRDKENFWSESSAVCPSVHRKCQPSPARAPLSGDPCWRWDSAASAHLWRRRGCGCLSYFDWCWSVRCCSAPGMSGAAERPHLLAKHRRHIIHQPMFDWTLGGCGHRQTHARTHAITTETRRRAAAVGKGSWWHLLSHVNIKQLE